MLALLVACTPVSAPPAEAPAPTAWDWAPPADTPVLLGTAELEAALTETIDATRATRARTVVDAFDLAMTHREEACPDYENNGPQSTVAGDCTTTDDWSWYGSGQLSHIRNFQVVLGDIDHWHRVWDYSTGNVRVVGPTETIAVMGQSWYRDYDTTDGARAISVELWGEFQVSGVPMFEGTWIAQDRGVQMYVDLVEQGGGWAGTWDVGISRLDGLVWAFVYDGFTLSSAAGACAEEPVGDVDLLDQAGTWYTVTFDGDVACDGCGAAASDGEPLGTVCADFSPLSVFAEDPWE